MCSGGYIFCAVVQSVHVIGYLCFSSERVVYSAESVVYGNYHRY
jgi:hypothetical protein